MKSLKLKLDGATCIQTLSVLDDYKKTVKFAKGLVQNLFVSIHFFGKEKLILKFQ